MMSSGVRLLGLLSLAVCCPVAFSGDAIDFQRDVAPLLARRCVECHGSDEQSGGLRLDQGITLGSPTDSGKPVIVAGDPKASELIIRVLSASASERMPPEGERLGEAEIEHLQRWISEGATGLVEVHESTKKVQSDHWSFQPLSRVHPPNLQEGGELGNPIDVFVSEQRTRRGLSAAPPASPSVLVRRLTYDLTGLPPSPEESQRFVARCVQTGDLSKVASQWIEELLARPEYGERWGRHWMDWVRYADTAGDNSDFPIREAYLYRNYIIDSFNKDVPYDRFIVEQLAGDLLHAESLAQRNQQVIATGYVAMARRFGSLVETYPWHLTIEDTIDNIGRTLLGLTISCARCHDHKFDPISTRDYYGLYGFFASTRYPFPGIELFQVPHHLVPLVEREELVRIQGPSAAKTAELEATLTEKLDQCQLVARQNAAKAKDLTIDQQRQSERELDDLLMKARKAGEQLASHLREVPEVPSGYAIADAMPMDAPVQIKGEPTRPGAIIRRKFLDVLGGQLLPKDQSGSGRLELAKWIADPANPLTTRVIVNRIWQRHFGSGLVATTSDFGLRGEEPTHPELLDHLAAEFIERGWSIKQLHRMILNSKTYQLASTDIVENLDNDPNNDYLWKFSRYRLDAESIRDTLLSASGELDRSLALDPHPFPPRNEWRFTQHHPFNDSFKNNKRSVYQMTKRLTADPTMQSFDGADPNVCIGQRDQSITPIQALYFFNDAFVHQQAELLAKRVMSQESDDRSRLKTLTILLLGRVPDSWEIDTFESYLSDISQQHDEATAWTSLTRSLIRTNEFIYVD